VKEHVTEAAKRQPAMLAGELRDG